MFSGNDAWSTSTNWSPALVPGAGDSAKIGGSLSANSFDVVLTANVQVADLLMSYFLFNSQSPSLSLSGYSFQCGNLTISQATLLVDGVMQVTDVSEISYLASISISTYLLFNGVISYNSSM